MSINILVPTSFANMQTSLIDAFGIQAQLYPRDCNESVLIFGIIAPTPLLEDSIPGSDKGTANIYFFVRFADIEPEIKTGDRLSINCVSYDINNVLVDRMGGATLKLRANGQC
jgi:hypothetical protein